MDCRELMLGMPPYCRPSNRFCTARVASFPNLKGDCNDASPKTDYLPFGLLESCLPRTKSYLIWLLESYLLWLLESYLLWLLARELFVMTDRELFDPNAWRLFALIAKKAVCSDCERAICPDCQRTILALTARVQFALTVRELPWPLKENNFPWL
jgi:hypothetical protein